MKFAVRVKLDVDAKGSGLLKDDLTPLVVEAVTEALEQSMHDALYDSISIETDREFDLSVGVDSVEA